MNRYRRTIFIILAALFACALQSTALASSNASIRASVVDIQTRQPLSGVKISAFDLHGTAVLATALSDEKGEFTIGGLRGGQYRLELAKSEYHRTMIVGLYVKPGEHMVVTGAIGMYSSKVRVPPTNTGRDPCRDLVLPGQTADVYVVCDQTR